MSAAYTTRRCHDRLTTKIPSNALFAFLQFSPFGVNVEAFSIAHIAIGFVLLAPIFLYLPFPLGLRTGGVPSARMHRAPPLTFTQIVLVCAMREHRNSSRMQPLPSLTASLSPHILSLANTG